MASRNLIFAYHYLLQKVKSFNFNGGAGSQAVTFEILEINQFPHVLILYLAKKSNFLPL